MTPCQCCGGPMTKVIYLGLPGRLCESEACSCLDGIAAHAPIVATETWLGPQFAYMPYEGWYGPALWRWLWGDWADGAAVGAIAASVSAAAWVALAAAMGYGLV